MYELEGCRQVDDLIVILATDCLVRKERDPWTDPLPACSDHVVADVGEQVLLAIDAAADASLDLLQFLRNRGVPGHVIAIIIVRCYLTLGDDAGAGFEPWPAPLSRYARRVSDSQLGIREWGLKRTEKKGSAHGVKKALAASWQACMNGSGNIPISITATKQMPTATPNAGDIFSWSFGPSSRYMYFTTRA